MISMVWLRVRFFKFLKDSELINYFWLLVDPDLRVPFDGDLLLLIRVGEKLYTAWFMDFWGVLPVKTYNPPLGSVPLSPKLANVSRYLAF